jgi:hypothetical protein
LRGEPVKSNVVLPKGKPNAINAINDLFLFLSNVNVIHFSIPCPNGGFTSRNISAPPFAPGPHQAAQGAGWGLFKVMFNFPLLDPPEISFFFGGIIPSNKNIL